jgi:multicomponent Na+:H+ antiporter subunit B
VGRSRPPCAGDPDLPRLRTGVSTYYIENAYADSRTPNMVTAVLADYRGFDTFGEAVVVVTAAAFLPPHPAALGARREDG